MYRIRLALLITLSLLICMVSVPESARAQRANDREIRVADGDKSKRKRRKKRKRRRARGKKDRGKKTRPKATGEQPAENAKADSAQPLAKEAPATTPDKRPWAEGVAKEKQDLAIAAYEEGTEQLTSGLFAQAAEKYREALEHWNHPGIHYNLALALINLDRPLEAYRSVQESLRYDARALEPAQHQQALNYRRLLERQVAEMTIMCSEDGARVSLDGQLLFVGPDKAKKLVLAGPHEITVTKPAHETVTRSVTARAGQPTQVEVRLFTAEEKVVKKRRWARWKPWAVVGGGAALGLIGAVLDWRARSNYSAFDSAFDDQCSDGCYDDGEGNELIRQRDRAQLQQRIGVAAYVTGGALFTVGAALVYFNRLRPFPRDRSGEEVQITVAPALLAPKTAGVVASFSF